MSFILDISIEHKSDALRRDFSAASIVLFICLFFLTTHLSEKSLKIINPVACIEHCYASNESDD